MEATRDFNFGVRYFNDKKFEAAIRSFERAASARTDPVIAYNLALSHLVALRELATRDQETDLSLERAAPALASVSSAQELPDLEDEMLAKLGYIEGEIYALIGNPEAAHRAFSRSLSADADFPPTLKAQLKLDTKSDSALAKLLLATADVEELELEEKLSP